MAVGVERELAVLFLGVEPEQAIELLGLGHVRHDEIEMIERMHAELAGPTHATRQTSDLRHARTSRILFVQAASAVAVASSTIGLRRIPMPSISSSQMSPAFMKTGGLRAAPTPAGVPVMMRSPGSSVIAADERDQRRDVEDQIGGGGALHDAAVEPHLDFQAMRAGRQFVGADENRAERPGIVEILADRPLRRAELKVADRSVVEDRIGADMREPGCTRYVAAALADHRDQLAFVIELVGYARTHDRLIVRDQARGKAGEQRRIIWRLHARFGGVVCVVQPDANDLSVRGKRPLELDDAEIDGFARSNECLGGRAQRRFAFSD